MESSTSIATRQRADENNSLETLAEETDTSLHLVKQIYTEELQALEQVAKVRTFVKVIAIRRTRQILQFMGSKDLTGGIH